MTDSDVKSRLLEAILVHVPFDGWSETSFRAAVADSGVAPALARGLFPRGAIDLALEMHRQGDAEMVRRLKAADLCALKMRERISAAIRFRLEVADVEAVRRAAALFALPMHAGDGARAIWQTVDAIWDTLGDSSEDISWYTKRATLAGVYSATLLYWMGDDSSEHQRSWRFLDRRIADVMRIETTKAKLRSNRLLRPALALPDWLGSHVRRPGRAPRVDLPGRLGDRRA